DRAADAPRVRAAQHALRRRDHPGGRLQPGGGRDGRGKGEGGGEVRSDAASPAQGAARRRRGARGGAVLALPLACLLVAAPAAAQAPGDTAHAPPTAAAPVFDGAYVLVPYTLIYRRASPGPN